jgi:hypothetical protein
MTVMSTDLSFAKKGDTVNIECYSGMGSGGPSKVKNILVKFDPDTGEKYNVIVVDDNHQFDCRTGDAMNAPTAYYINSFIKSKE